MNVEEGWIYAEEGVPPIVYNIVTLHLKTGIVFALFYVWPFGCRYYNTQLTKEQTAVVRSMIAQGRVRQALRFVSSLAHTDTAAPGLERAAK